MKGNALWRTRLFDWLSLLFVWSCATLFATGAVMLFFSLISVGLSQIDFNFLLSEPVDSGRGGGIAPVIVSTILIVSVCILVAVPLGTGTAIILSEHSLGRLSAASWIRVSLDILGGIPSIVFGLFGNAFFCIALGMGYSILSGGLTLACMVLPIYTRIAEPAIRTAAVAHRQSASALALSRWTFLFHVVLPKAFPGLVAALTLAIARALAETAALIFTSGYVSRHPSSLFDSGRSLSVHIYDMALNVTGGNERAYAAALVLVLLLLGLNFLTRAFVRRLT